MTLLLFLKKKTMKKEFPYKRILVIDDNEIDFFLAHTHIKRYSENADLFFAMDVDSGLNLFKSFTNDQKPDLILLDLNFNRQQLQGIDFIKEFEKLPKESISSTEVMLLTAFSGYDEGKLMREKYGVLKMVEKPFTVEKILAS